MQIDPIRGATVAVTGATGFVGSRLVRALEQRGAHVHAFGRRPGHGVERGRYTYWDIALGPLTDAPRADALVHCAGLVTDWGSRSQYSSCHVDGTRNVMASFPEPCAVVHVSTASVYDPFGERRLLREDAPLAARYLNAYSETKAQAERLVRSRSRHVILRPHAIYGPGDRVLLPKLLDATWGGRQLAIGDGSNSISVTHVENLVDAAVLGIEALLHGKPAGTFNIADEVPVRIDTALRAVLAAVGRDVRIVYLPRAPAYAAGALLEWAFAPLGTKRGPRLTRYRVIQVADEYTLDLAHAKTVLGYRPTRSLLQFIADGGLSGV